MHRSKSNPKAKRSDIANFTNREITPKKRKEKKKKRKNSLHILFQVCTFCSNSALIFAHRPRISRLPQRHAGLYRPDFCCRMSNDLLTTNVLEKIKKKDKRQASAKQLEQLALARVFECSSLSEAVEVACEGHSITPEVVAITGNRLKRKKRWLTELTSVLTIDAQGANRQCV